MVWKEVAGLAGENGL